MIVFTLCSNNYLAQAKTLGDSLLKHNPDYKFIIGLTDELNPLIDYSFFKPYTIIPVAEIGIEDFDNLWKKYDIIEFNTCVKASYFKYLFSKDPDSNAICYFDPDILVFHSLNILEKEFDGSDILITPHIISPILPDGLIPGENLFLNYGLYNLGFIGLSKNTIKVDGFLDWWEHRTLHYGHDDVSNGFFVDQLWINFVPIFFKRTKILLNQGYNVGPWNLHEREIGKNGKGNYIMNGNAPLYFFHFSSFRYTSPFKMSKHYERYNFETHPQLKELYQKYNQSLLENNIEYYSTIHCSFILRKEKYLEQQKSLEQKVLEQKSLEQKENRMKKFLKLFVPPILLKIKNYK